MKFADRFRFRAWDLTIKAMCSPVHIAFSGSEFTPTGLDGLILMQSTGLSDKNGNEIFEGDILQGDFNEGYYERAQVMWDQDLSRFRFQSLTGAAWEPRIVDGHVLTLRVIGNIYESQELLEEKMGIV